MKSKAHFFGGTSNIALLVANKAAYPEGFRDKSRLTYYSSLFNSLEVNSTFKKNPLPTTIERWTTEVGANFQFSFKMPASVTHNPNVEFNETSITNFLEVIRHAGSHAGVTLLQFPGKVSTEYLGQVEKILNVTRAFHVSRPWKVALEFRHSSWYTEESKRIFRKYKVAMVIHDLPTFENPGNENMDSSFIYLRLHGPEKGYKGSYSSHSLQRYADRIKEWMAGGKDVYAYFNNTLGAAAQNLLALNELVKVAR